jgi:hypothetical protein
VSASLSPSPACTLGVLIMVAAARHKMPMSVFFILLGVCFWDTRLGGDVKEIGEGRKEVGLFNFIM